MDFPSPLLNWIRETAIEVDRNPKVEAFIKNELGFTSCISDKDAQMLSACGIEV